MVGVGYRFGRALLVSRIIGDDNVIVARLGDVEELTVGFTIVLMEDQVESNHAVGSLKIKTRCR